MKIKSHLVKTISFAVIISLMFTSCISTTMIRSYPEGAKIRVDGEDKGITPYRHKDSKVVMSSTDIQLKMDGYRTLNTSIYKDEEINVVPAVAGFFVLIPWLWALEYKSNYTFDLKPEVSEKKPSVAAPIETAPQTTSPAITSKADRLRELKGLLDDDIITQTEFDEQKKKILAE